MKVRTTLALALPAAIVGSVGIATSAATSAQASVFRTIDAEDALISGDVLADDGHSYPIANQNSQDAWAPLISVDLAHGGSHALKFVVAPDTDGVKERTEVHISEGIDIENVRYTSFWMYVREDFQSYAEGRNSRELFMQLWQGVPKTDGSWGGYPPLALYFKPGSDLDYEVVIKQDGEQHEPSENQIKYTDELPKGQWVNFVIGWHADPTGNEGFVQVWQDGEEKYTYNGRWAYSETITTSKTFKYRNGLYGNPAQSITARQVVYFDDFRYGNSYDSVTTGPPDTP